MDSEINYQGRLTDSGSNPLNGTYDMQFQLWNAETGGSQVGTDITVSNVSVDNGLFNVKIPVTHSWFNGQALWLRVKVGTDDWMTPRQEILPAPYALSLRPGARILGDSDEPILQVSNHGDSEDGEAVYGYSLNSVGLYALSDSDEEAAVFGHSRSTGGGVEGWCSQGVGVYGHGDTGVFGYSSWGQGVRAGSAGGVAIAATGTGIITSTANSYLWMSGNGVRPYHQNDTTVIDMDPFGGAFIKRDSGSGSRNVMLPITVLGPLYGQDVTISSLDIYWQGETEFDRITAVILRRQTGVGSKEEIIYDVGGPGYSCVHYANPGGCAIHYDPTSNNVLTASSGVLYLTLEVAFNTDISWVQVGGVRLTLEHD